MIKEFAFIIPEGLSLGVNKDSGQRVGLVAEPNGNLQVVQQVITEGTPRMLR